MAWPRRRELLASRQELVKLDQSLESASRTAKSISEEEKIGGCIYAHGRWPFGPALDNPVIHRRGETIVFRGQV